VADTNAGGPVVEQGYLQTGDPTAAGNILANDTDVDASDILTVTGVVSGGAAGPISGGAGATIAGTYGSIVIAADGTWTYTLDNTNPRSDPDR